MKVLIAEDDVGTSYALCRLLGAWGFETLAVAHAADARAVLDGPAPPAMAVVEQELAGGSGVELCRQIRRPGQDSYTYVLVIGAILDLELTNALVEAGANDFLAKPFEIHELRRRMESGRRLVEAVAAGGERARLGLEQKQLQRTRRKLEAAMARPTPHRGVLVPSGGTWKWDV
jgi:sigma-B regulation protein RsbU (phosphoserine phosphatase)